MSIKSSQIRENVIEYAKRIAQYQKYPCLENGLQPIEDYECNGVRYPGLNTKYTEHFLEVRTLLAQYHLKEKTEWHILRKAAVVYYYACQIEVQTQQPVWATTYASIKIYLPRLYWREREVENAADALFAWRSSSEKNKDENLEIEIIRDRIESCPRRPGAAQGNQYNKKRTSGRPLSVYLRGEDIERLQAILAHRGIPINVQEENRLTRAILPVFILNEYEKITHTETE
jgi:hypothetical protein